MVKPSDLIFQAIDTHLWNGVDHFNDFSKRSPRNSMYLCHVIDATSPRAYEAKEAILELLFIEVDGCPQSVKSVGSGLRVLAMIGNGREAATTNSGFASEQAVRFMLGEFAAYLLQEDGN